MLARAAESPLRAPRKGAAATVNAEVENLPRRRQTLLFSCDACLGKVGLGVCYGPEVTPHARALRRR